MKFRKHANVLLEKYSIEEYTTPLTIITFQKNSGINFSNSNIKINFNSGSNIILDFISSINHSTQFGIYWDVNGQLLPQFRFSLFCPNLFLKYTME